MSKKLFGMKLLGGATAVTLAALMAGCGSAPGSEGISFTLVGAYQEAPIQGCNQASSLTSISLVTASFSELTETAATSNGVPVTLLAQNNTSATSIRGVSVQLDYYAPGSSIDIPSTIVPFAGVSGPGSVATGGTAGSGFDSSLPSGSSTFCTTIANRINVITPQIRDYLRFNLDVEPPLDVIVTATVIGVTSAGDRIETNPISFTVNFTTDTVINGGTTSTTTGAETTITDGLVDATPTPESGF